MNDYVFRNDIKEYMLKAYPLLKKSYLIKTINEIPTAKKKGKWYKDPQGDVLKYWSYTCSVCGDVFGSDNEFILEAMNYCPHCGAEMIEFFTNASAEKEK